MSEKINDADLVLVRKACESLVEHFDSVQIFVTRHEPSSGGTIRSSQGLGDWYARFGHVYCWVKAQEQDDVYQRNKDNP